jgi:hypothetical protein
VQKATATSAAAPRSAKAASYSQRAGESHDHLNLHLFCEIARPLAKSRPQKAVDFRTAELPHNISI